MSYDSDGRRQCPDGGRCHHHCAETECFRVRACGPLSGVYPDNNWPADVQRKFGTFKPKPKDEG